MKESLNIVLAGEVDSGKSTLIGRLLYDTDSVPKQAKEELEKASGISGRSYPEFAHLLDSFQEERQEEFTLDTTQAFLKTPSRDILLIDVPGHPNLIKNMLTGASLGDGALVVVDVAKSLEEQTRRHLYLLKFLGIRDVAVVVNKMDSVNYSQESFDKVREEIDSFFRKMGLDLKMVIPVSAREGENCSRDAGRMPWYEGPSLIQALEGFGEAKITFSDFRFPVQDIYEVGQEKILLGTIISGEIVCGETVQIALSKEILKVKAIKVFGEKRKRAFAKESIGLVVDKYPEALGRGAVLYQGRLPSVGQEVCAKIFCLAPLGLDEEVIFQCATGDIPVVISCINEVIDTVSFEIHAERTLLKACDAAQVVLKGGFSFVAENFITSPELGSFTLQGKAGVVAIGVVC